MMAVVVEGCGGPEVLQLRDIPRPQIRHPFDVLVRVRAAGVNPGDCQNRQHGAPAYALGKAPPAFSVLGMDGAGIVEEVGEGVRDWAPGDAVWYYDGGFADKHGSYAEYKIVSGHYLAPKPKSVGFPMAAAMPVVALTAWEAVVERANVQRGDFVLVQGGAGGVGHVSVQLAAARGAHVATTVSGPAKAALARSMGAELTIDYTKENVPEAIGAWRGKSGADVVLDFVGGETFASSFGLVAPYGALVNTVVANWPPGNNMLAEYNNLNIKFVNIGWPQVAANHDGRVRQTNILREVAMLVDRGALRVHLDRVYALQDVSEAHRALETGRVMGRVVVQI